MDKQIIARIKKNQKHIEIQKKKIQEYKKYLKKLNRVQKILKN